LRGFVANTDYDWFTFLRAIEPPVDEVNFWRPGSEGTFKALQAGEPIFFRLKSPRNAIGGFGYFAHYSTLPVSMAWEIYGVANGAPSFRAMRDRLTRFRTRFDMATDPKADFWIGCLLVHEPVFFAENDWVKLPHDWASNIVQGKSYDLSSGEGERIWLECLGRVRAPQPIQPSLIADGTVLGGYGSPATIHARLGQRSFRVAVLDSYDRRCAVTSERTLPALEAAHIRRFSDVQEHSISNGLLLRADLHKLFDSGYVTVTPEHIFQVSRKIKEEFENGRDYYRLEGSPIRLPSDPAKHPQRTALAWHNENRYLG
jgi:putative restriction endonuclease